MNYENYLIKKYKHWSLYLHINQYPYIGRCYAWANRESANHFSDMNDEELLEFKNIIVPKYEEIIKKIFPNINRFNYTVMGNEAPHLHWHLIPRYNSPVEYKNILFKDNNLNKNYAPYEKIKIEEAILKNILEDISIRF